MSKRRTKTQKQMAHNHYQLGSWFSEPTDKGKTQTEVQPQISALTLYGYEPTLINRDLWRTTVVVLAILIIEILMYFYRV